MSVTTDRMVALRRLIGIRRDIEMLIKKLSSTDALRNFVEEVDATAYMERERYEGPEDAEVVAARWGVDLEPPDEGSVPDWVLEKIGRHMAGGSEERGDTLGG